MRDYLSATVVFNSGIWEGVLTWAKARESSVFVAQSATEKPSLPLCSIQRSPSSALCAPLYSSLPAELNRINNYPYTTTRKEAPHDLI